MKFNSAPFEAALRATGLDLQKTPAEVGVFAATLSAELALLSAEAGFGEAVEAAADRVWMFTANRAVRSGDAADARAIGLIHGVLLGLAGV